MLHLAWLGRKRVLLGTGGVLVWVFRWRLQFVDALKPWFFVSLPQSWSLRDHALQGVHAVARSFASSIVSY